jgi:2-phospho-L-lactate transferase/gluconeogenesis factor (CofD/UPF0052 family)
MSGRDHDGFVLALSGGIGGAKLALGLSRVLPPGRLTVVANTGDDFEHLGLSISPDLDTLMYTLAGVDNPETGWGRRGETWTFMAQLAARAGSSSATATLQPMSSGHAACVRARRSRRSPRICGAVSGSRHACCR